MKRINLLAVFLFASAVCSCNNNANSSSSSDSAPTSIEVTDMVGRKVRITPGTYSKVVCIGAGALRMYSYIGDVNLLAGVEDIDNYTLDNRPKMFDGVARPYFIANKELFASLPSCGVGGPNAQVAEAEKILLCNPDIVISEYEDVDKENALQEQLGVPVITLKYGSKGVFDTACADSFTLLGKVFNKESRASELNSFITSETNKISEATKNIAEENKKSTYICGLGNWGTTNHLMTASNFASFNVANIKNAVSSLAISGIGAIEKEKFVEVGQDMDIMIIDSAAVKNIKSEDVSLLKTTKAWSNNEVYLQMAYNAYYTNLEIALINTWFDAKVVYPELFKDVDMVAKTNEITKAFLGKELASEINSYKNSFGGYQKIDTATFFKN